MNTRMICLRTIALPLFVLSLAVLQAPAALGQSPVKLQRLDQLTILEYVDTAGQPAVLDLAGEASHLGRFSCHGELFLTPGAVEGQQEVNGVADFTAANGDHIVGIVTGQIDADGSLALRFPWRDCVGFSDGTIACSTGRFAQSRPPGLIVVESTAKCGLVCYELFGFRLCKIVCQ